MRVWREPLSGAVVEDRVYPVTTVTMTGKAGIITGEVIELKVTERVEKGSDRIVSPARLTGTLRLENISANRTVRLVEGRILFIDAQGQPIKLEAPRTDPIVKLAMYGTERLDPGQGVSHTLDVEFPVEALKAKKLTELRLELAYIPSCSVRRRSTSWSPSARASLADLEVCEDRERRDDDGGDVARFHRPDS